MNVISEIYLRRQKSRFGAGRETSVPRSNVNLDALIRRQDMAAEGDKPYQAINSIKHTELESGKIHTMCCESLISRERHRVGLQIR